MELCRTALFCRTCSFELGGSSAWWRASTTYVAEATILFHLRQLEQLRSGPSCCLWFACYSPQVGRAGWAPPQVGLLGLWVVGNGFEVHVFGGTICTFWVGRFPRIPAHSRAFPHISAHFGSAVTRTVPHIFAFFLWPSSRTIHLLIASLRRCCIRLL